MTNYRVRVLLGTFCLLVTSFKVMNKIKFFIKFLSLYRRGILASMLLIGLTISGCSQLKRASIAKSPDQMASSPVVVSTPEADTSTPEIESEKSDRGLPSEQKKEIRKIHRSALAQVNEILTPAQQTQLQTQLEEKKSRKDKKQKLSLQDELSSLNLTAEQKSKITEILKSAKAQIKAVKNSAQPAQQ